MFNLTLVSTRLRIFVWDVENSGSINSQLTVPITVLRCIAASLSHIGFMYSTLDALELRSSPDNMTGLVINEELFHSATLANLGQGSRM